MRVIGSTTATYTDAESDVQAQDPPQTVPFLKELVGETSVPGVPTREYDHVYATIYEIGGPVTEVLSFMVNKKMALVPHVGVRVYGKEWFYSNRIEHEPVEVMDKMLEGMPSVTFDLGRATLSKEEVEEWIESVNDEWVAETYDVFNRNCNNFGILMASEISEGGIPEPYGQATIETMTKLLDNLPNWRKEMGLHFMTKITRLIVSSWGRATRDKKEITARNLDLAKADADTKTGGMSQRKRTTSTELSAVAVLTAVAEDTTEIIACDNSFGPSMIGKGAQLPSVRDLKKVEDKADSPFAEALLAIDSTGTIRRRLWTKADFMHIHAITGTYFLALGMAWLLYSHVVGFQNPEQMMGTTGPFLASLLLTGLGNALSAIPMSRFSSDKMFDFEDLKANGFTIGGTGLTCMSLWVAWWFSGSYPDALEPLNTAFFFLWAAICVGSTANWEYMLQQNFENSTGKARRGKFGKQTQDEMNKKALLYRIASWPNLTQLMFISSIPLGGREWVGSMTDTWPMQMIPMYHYGLVSAIGYALSMLAETLRDRKLIDLQTDLMLLIFGFLIPIVSVVVDSVTYGDAITINPLDYWVIFAGATPGL